MWILPTFNRPERCAEALASIEAAGVTTPGLVVVNGRERRAEYEKLSLPLGWRFRWNDENVGMTRALNDVFDEHPFEFFYGFINDDEVVRSPAWDQRLVSAAGPWKLAHGNDGWQSEKRVHGTPVIGGDLARAVGALAIRTCFHWYSFDAMWEHIDKALAVRVFCADVALEHRHWLNVKSGARPDKDVTYAHAESKSKADYVQFHLWKRAELKAIIERVKYARDQAVVASRAP